MSGRQSAGRIDEEAARWVLRLDREGRSGSVEAELEDWLEGDIRRHGALLRAEATWASLDQISYEAQAVAPRERRSASSVRNRLRVIGGVGFGLAAGLAALVLLPSNGDTYRTAVGEIRRVPLADRSIAAINTSSRIDVVFEPGRREVTLDEGEAWFQVAKDRTRPFVVEAGSLRVEAVGTAFSVRRSGTGAEVLVTEGIVRAWAVGFEARAVLVTAGSRASLTSDVLVVRAATSPSAIDRQLAWRAGRIDLAGETLGAAVGEFNRYNERKISVRDPEVGGKRLYGVFRTDDPESFAKAAALSLDARAYATGSGDIIIEARRRAGSGKVSQN